MKCIIQAWAADFNVNYPKVGMNLDSSRACLPLQGMSNSICAKGKSFIRIGRAAAGRAVAFVFGQDESGSRGRPAHSHEQALARLFEQDEGAACAPRTSNSVGGLKFSWRRTLPSEPSMHASTRRWSPAKRSSCSAPTPDIRNYPMAPPAGRGRAPCR